MTLSELRTLLGQLQALDLDNIAGSAPSAATLTTQINDAIKWLVTHTEVCYDDRIALTLTADVRRYDIQSTSIVAKRLLRCDMVVINGQPLRDANGVPGLMAFSEFQLSYPGYLTAASGTPTRAAMIDARNIILDPAPTSTVVSDGNNFVAGPYIPADLVNSTDDANQPDFPLQYHRHIAYVAASMTSEGLVSEGEGWRRLERLDARVALDIQKMMRESVNKRSRSNLHRGLRADWGPRTTGGWDGRW